MLSVTDEALAVRPFTDRPDAAEDALAGLIRQAQDADAADPGADARTEAVGLLAMAAGMGTGVLVGQRTPESAAAVLRHHLDRVFAPSASGAPDAG